MNSIQDVNHKAGIDKLKKLVKEINICLFCTYLKTDDGASCRPMSALSVCDQGNIWFYSDIHSDKNREIIEDKYVQLFFSNPEKGSYLIVNGVAEIRTDKQKIEELWVPEAKIWFTEGKDDPSISIIKVTPGTAYYWDTEGNRMINFIKMVASLATGADLITSHEGNLTVK